MNRQRKPLSESINNKINMVRNVFNKKRFEDLQDEMFRSRVKQSLRGISEESEEVQLLVESKRMKHIKLDDKQWKSDETI
jgi:hypothetical protein